MSPERWREVKAVFQGALELEPDRRAAYLDGACEGDAVMRDEVESLLAALEATGGFLEGSRAAGAPGAPAEAARTKFCSRCRTWYDLEEVVCPSDGEALVEDPAALLGTTLDGLYQVESLLGRGGFGTVYLARHALLRDRVAIKVLRRDLAANPAFVRRFLREGRAARAIRHPNVVTIHDLRATDGGLVYIVMEPVDGRTLREELRRRERFGTGEALAVLEQVAAALDAAHALGVVHRDLKPENVMLSGDGGRLAVKVLDLGLAKLREAAGDPLEAATDLTLPGQRMGSPRYMSPEQWGVAPGDGGEPVDARTDVYSLGVVAFELLTGRAPFSGESVWELRRLHVETPPPSASDLLDDLPEPAGRAIARAMAKDRASRHASAGELVDELARALDEPAAARPGTTWRAHMPRRVAAAGAAAVLALAAGGAGIVAWREAGATDDAAVATTREPGTAPAAAKRYAEMSEGERLAFVDERARRVSEMLVGRELRFPPDVRASIKLAVDRYAARVGTGSTAPGSEDVTFVLERARQYAPYLTFVFDDLGVPPVVGLYLPFVESEYRAGVVSPGGARGIFQIMPETARKYGAAAEDLDEPIKAAPVAARYVRDRVDEFAPDPMRAALAVAAYNLGAREIRRFMTEVVALDDAEAEMRFWALMGNTGFDTVENRETPRYIATFFAAAVVGESPGAFGIEMQPLSSYTRHDAGR